jgi:phenylpropionate dioxygenase-like ring-hydroxylating dioxygenase large terminal subunit
VTSQRDELQAVERPNDGGGSAYGRPAPTSTLALTKVGAGTGCGEFLRRFWHPIAVSSTVSSRPVKVKLLGEELILFRDAVGRPGLLYPRCMHRGTSLFYGKVEERGIRCCYHGWLFDVRGNCLEQPCEPDGGRHRDKARQPWYPVEERYGLVFAYLGPLDRKPLLPRYDILEDLEEGERIATEDGTRFGQQGDRGVPVMPYTWLHTLDNFMDPFHVYLLHSTFSVEQFASGFSVLPTVEFEYVPNGIIYRADRTLEDGRKVTRVSCLMIPNVASVPDIDLKAARSSTISWTVPLDDTHHQSFRAIRTRQSDEELFKPLLYGNKTWSEMTVEERRDLPSDLEAQGGQGTLTLNSEEHLVSSDRGIIMLRRMLLKQIEAMGQGAAPAGVNIDPVRTVVKIPSGNFYVDPSPG